MALTDIGLTHCPVNPEVVCPNRKQSVRLYTEAIDPAYVDDLYEPGRERGFMLDILDEQAICAQEQNCQGVDESGQCPVEVSPPAPKGIVVRVVGRAAAFGARLLKH